MSKIKEALLKEQDNLMEYYIGFHEWLDSLNNDLNEKDIENMEEEYCNTSSTISNKPNGSISKAYVKEANNKNYFPMKGA